MAHMGKCLSIAMIRTDKGVQEVADCLKLKYRTALELKDKEDMTVSRAMELAKFFGMKYSDFCELSEVDE